VATIGRKVAIAELGKLHLSGLLAWMAWLMVHIFFLIGFRNRFVVIFNLGMVLFHVPARHKTDYGKEIEFVAKPRGR
jgi:NADH dehydrogenase